MSRWWKRGGRRLSGSTFGVGLAVAEGWLLFAGLCDGGWMGGQGFIGFMQDLMLLIFGSRSSIC